VGACQKPYHSMTSYYDTFALKMLLSGIIMPPINTPNASYRVKKSPYGAVMGTKNANIGSLNDANG
jgi:hypothetical protein